MVVGSVVAAVQGAVICHEHLVSVEQHLDERMLRTAVRFYAFSTEVGSTMEGHV
jgi:hypothetical protein